MHAVPQPALIATPLEQREQRKVFSVSAVVARADAVLRERAPHPIWVRGEVSGWKRHRSGHCYFRLKDDKAEMDCVLWRDRAQQLPALPADGMEVDALGNIGIYGRQGRFQLDVSRLETTGGDGLWHVARERLMAQLRGEGLLDEARKRPIPAFPETIGLVTSTSGAALQDMWRTMRRRAWWVRVLVSGCAVEGAQSAPDIVRAIRRFGPGPGQVPVDLVIVARGGGSRESLWAFNTEPVARAIAECPVPVISAVGHETDYTVGDFVADLRAATPTAGAEHATPDGRDLLERLDAYPSSLRVRLGRLLGDAEEDFLTRTDALHRRVLRRHRLLLERAVSLDRMLHARAPRERQQRMRERLEALEDALHRAVRQRQDGLASSLAEQEREIQRALRLRLQQLEHGLARRAAETDARSPLRALARGYAVVSDADGRVVRDPAEAPAGTPLRLRVAGGTLRATSDGPEPSDDHA